MLIAGAVSDFYSEGGQLAGKASPPVISTEKGHNFSVHFVRKILLYSL